jgi:hypothetical protein
MQEPAPDFFVLPGHSAQPWCIEPWNMYRGGAQIAAWKSAIPALVSD